MSWGQYQVLHVSLEFPKRKRNRKKHKKYLKQMIKLGYIFFTLCLWLKRYGFEVMNWFIHVETNLT